MSQHPVSATAMTALFQTSPDDSGGFRVSAEEDANIAQAKKIAQIKAGIVERFVDIPKPGDVIYVDTELYIWHGSDDFRGGKAIIRAVRMGNSGREETASVEVDQNPGTWYTWALLAEKQAELAAKFGDAWAHANPDLRPEFNDDVP